MSQPDSHGSGGASPLYTSNSSGITYRQTSYASVAAGTAAASQIVQSLPRQGAFSHLMNPTPSSPVYSHQSPYNHSSRMPQPSLDQHSGADGGIDIPGTWGRAGDTPNNSSEHYYGHGRAWPDLSTSGIHGFFTPTHLRGSRYMEKLVAAYKSKINTKRDASSTHTSHGGSLSTSSSSVSLHKMAPSHRGMAYEIIERPPPPEDDGVSPLPSKWGEVDKFGGLEIASDGLDVKYVGVTKMHDHEAVAARADQPMPPECGLYYFEVEIISKGKEGMIGVGFSSSKASLEKLPGWEPESWAWHGDDGKTFCCQPTGKSYGPKFTNGDIIGCGVNFSTGCAFFTKNGVFQGIAFKELKDVDLYPSVGMKRPQAHLSVNFGQKPFVYDIDSMMTSEKSNILREISGSSVAKLNPTADENILLKELVAQFLVHDGYIETAKAFATEVQTEAAALGGTSTINGPAMEDDLDALNRQQIRTAILDGDIDKALKRTRAYYPQVLQDNSPVYFRLRCRKFVEMIRESAELLEGPSVKRGKRANGHSVPHIEDDLDPEMELDEQLNGGDDWDQMETEEADNGLRYQDLVQDTLRYGQELRHEFLEDRSNVVRETFKEIWSFYAYEDPRKSPVAHLLDPQGRVPVAEELNSAILVSLGKSSSAAIERLIQQTEVLVDEISEEGGAGAFINVRNDFLR